MHEDDDTPTAYLHPAQRARLRRHADAVDAWREAWQRAQDAGGWGPEASHAATPEEGEAKATAARAWLEAHPRPMPEHSARDVLDAVDPRGRHRRTLELTPLGRRAAASSGFARRQLERLEALEELAPGIAEAPMLAGLRDRLDDPEAVVVVLRRFCRSAMQPPIRPPDPTPSPATTSLDAARRLSDTLPQYVARRRGLLQAESERLRLAGKLAGLPDRDPGRPLLERCLAREADTIHQLRRGISDDAAEIGACRPLVLDAVAEHDLDPDPFGWDLRALEEDTARVAEVVDVCRQAIGRLLVAERKPRAGGGRLQEADAKAESRTAAEPELRMLDTTAAAARMGKSERQVRRLCGELKYPCHRARQHAGKWSIPEDDVPE